MESARKEVVWMKESLGGGLRVMSMGRVSAGRTRATVDNIDKLSGLAFRTAERDQGGKDVFWTHPRMVYYDHGIEFANVGIG